MKKNILGTTIFVLLSSTILFAGANAGIEQEVHAGDKVELNGAESTLDRDGRFVRFNWRQTGGKPYVSLSNRRNLKTTFIAPIVTESTVLRFRLTTKEKFKNRRNKKRIFRSRNYVDVIVHPDEEVVVHTVPPTNSTGTISHNGLNYLPVTSPTTGRIWLDRNLGAKRACSSVTDKACFGDYYQWGRGTDGHQVKGSKLAEGTIGLYEISNKFMTGEPEDGSYVSFDDWTGASLELRASIWSETDGTSVCPVDYRVPTIVEIEDEKLNTLVDNSAIANQFLKLPLAGYRPTKGRGNIYGINKDIRLWSTSTVFAGFSTVAYRRNVIRNFPVYKNGKIIEPNTPTSISSGRLVTSGGNGTSVRCIKD